jgi:hypothetical protein
MKKLNLLAFYLISFVLMSFSCSKEKIETPDTACAGALCTAQFAMLNIHVKDAKGAELPMNEIKVTANGKLIRTETIPSFGSTASYTVSDDSFLNGTLARNSQIDIQVEGIKGSKSMFTKTITIGSDCCHIFLKSGTLDVVVQ